VLTRDLDHKRLRSFKAKAFHYQLDARRSDPVEGSRSARTPLPSLEEMLRTRLEARILASDIPREKLIELGIGYLTAAAARDEAKPIASTEASDVAA
jgi:hypothetical protein